MICRATDISKYFRESLGIRDNESRLYLKRMMIERNEYTHKTENSLSVKLFWSDQPVLVNWASSVTLINFPKIPIGARLSQMTRKYKPHYIKKKKKKKKKFLFMRSLYSKFQKAVKPLRIQICTYNVIAIYIRLYLYGEVRSHFTATAWHCLLL